MFKILPLLSVLALIGSIICEPTPDGNHDHGPGAGPGGIRPGSGGGSGGYDLPPPPPPADPAPIADLPPPGPIGGFGFPGLGFGLNAGAGAGISPFLGGIGGNLGIGGGLGGYGGPGGPVGGGFLGPSYLPSTWLGSALGAKGDILFPCVIIIFFVVGIWTVINFLLALTVPLIGAKLGFANSITNAFKRKGRSAEGDDGDDDTEALTQNVTDAIDTEY